MIELPNGEDYGIAIKLGRYDVNELVTLLEYIQNNYGGVIWWGGENPTEFIPDFTADDEEYYADEIADFALFIEKDNELDWGSASSIYDEYRDYDYIVYTSYEFMNDIEETEIENEMDVSFLYGG